MQVCSPWHQTGPALHQSHLPVSAWRQARRKEPAGRSSCPCPALQALVQALGQPQVDEGTRGQVAGVLKGLQASSSQLVSGLSAGERSALSDLTNH